MSFGLDPLIKILLTMPTDQELSKTMRSFFAKLDSDMSGCLSYAGVCVCVCVHACRRAGGRADFGIWHSLSPLSRLLSIFILQKCVMGSRR